jgi:hypothetical protein
MKVYVLDLTGLGESRRMDSDTAASGSLLLTHIATHLIPPGCESIEDLAKLPVRDKVGAMILLGIAMRWIADSRAFGWEMAFEVASDLFAKMGVSSELEPCASSQELLQQLN